MDYLFIYLFIFRMLIMLVLSYNNFKTRSENLYRVNINQSSKRTFYTWHWSRYKEVCRNLTKINEGETKSYRILKIVVDIALVFFAIASVILMLYLYMQRPVMLDWESEQEMVLLISKVNTFCPDLRMRKSKYVIIEGDNAIEIWRDLFM